jgi:hypothetical protein
VPWTWTDSQYKRPKLRKMDMRFGTWNVRSLYRTGSLVTVAKAISKHELDLVGVQEVRWDRGCTEQAGEYTTFFYEKGNENHGLGTGFFCTLRLKLVLQMWKNYKSPGSGQFRQNWIKQEVRSINTSILFGIRKNCLIGGRNPLLCHFTRREIKLTVVIIVGYHCYQLHAKYYPICFSQG